MFSLFGSSRRRQHAAETDAILAAVNRAQASIEFSLDGKIVDANANFLDAMGYTLPEIVGRHHSIFVPAAEADTESYREFWDDLRAGQFKAAEFKRIAKGGREVWIQASYNPILDAAGKAVRIIKFATDITAQKMASADAAGQLAAIGKSQAVIEFSVDGEILTANDIFCRTLSYRLDDIRGKHHRIFVLPEDAADPAYSQFWQELGRGQFQAGEYRRVGKNGQIVWIQATYNPIFDPSGRVYKIVKFATNVTERKRAIEAFGASLFALAQGDLTKTIDESFGGGMEEVRQAINQSITNFSTIVEKLRLTSRSLKSATGEILAGSNNLAERTTKQAATIEETSAAMEQLAHTVVENAKRAESASVNGRSVSAAARESETVMAEADAAMERISTSSAKISSIIGLIDDIAFQTNLLALNASVEAARAGDAGKGFAVVAVEVRRLAQSAASASSEVKVLIEQSANEVRNGSRLVSEVANKLNLMLAGFAQNSELITDIAQASQEQSGAITEVSIAVRRMDEMTQHNAALVEETNAAIEQTEEQASELDRIVDQLITDRAQVRTAPAHPVPVAGAPGTVRAMQDRVRQAARSYGSRSGAAPDWNEF